MKSSTKLIFYSLAILIITSCSLIKSHLIQEGGPHDVYIDKKNEPYLYIDSKPQSKYRFINKLGIEKEIKDISKQWIKIEQLKREFYFHLSFGNGGMYKFVIGDNKFYEIFPLESAPGTPILKYTQKSDTVFSYTIKNQLQETDKERIINFYIIDKQQQIAIVEDLDGFVPYRFMIAAQKKYNLPVLINYCRERRLVEFMDFDKVDFKKILKDRGFI
ncbi:MAG: hypothetical protein LBE37_02755 [Sphingobacterium sp.]|jgi:hypothetical protein|nr:hypothetical protein [Sphingobacterium sp.]